VFQNSPTDDVYHLKQKLVAIISKPAYNLPVNDVYHLKQKLEAIISKPAYNLPVIDVYHLKQKLEVMISKPAYNLPVLRACGVLPPCLLPHSFCYQCNLQFTFKISFLLYLHGAQSFIYQDKERSHSKKAISRNKILQAI
jgi:hypothetical protein